MSRSTYTVHVACFHMIWRILKDVGNVVLMLILEKGTETQNIVTILFN